MSNPLEALIPHQDKTRQQDGDWATVSSVNYTLGHVYIYLDNSSVEIGPVVSLVDPDLLTIGDRVYILTQNKRLVILGKEDGPDLVDYLKASQAEVVTGTQDNKFLTPKTLRGIRATQAEVDAGTDTSKYVTPETLAGRTVPFGHKGKTNGFQTTSSVVVVGMAPAQVLAGGMSENTNALIVPRAGKYLLTARFYSTGSSGYVAVGYLRHTGEVSALSVDTWKANSNDYMFMATGIRQLNAGDQVWLEHTGGGSTWGTNGWNGAWVEALWIGP